MRRLVALALSVPLALAGLTALGGTSYAVQTPQTRLVSDNPANFTPHVLDGEVNAIIQVGNTMVVGGNFTQVQAASGGGAVARTNIFAFNATTGALNTTFAPTLNGEVTSLVAAPDGSRSTSAVGSTTSTASRRAA